MESLDRDTFRKARACLDQAMAEDPGFAMPVAWAARWHSIHVGQGWSSDPKADITQASALAASAIHLDPQNALALAIYGHQRSYLFHDCDSAQAYLNRALLAGPSISLAWALSSCTLTQLRQSYWEVSRKPLISRGETDGIPGFSEYVVPCPAVFSA